MLSYANKTGLDAEIWKELNRIFKMPKLNSKDTAAMFARHNHHTWPPLPCDLLTLLCFLSIDDYVSPKQDLRERMQLPNNQGLGGINEFYEFNIEPDGLASLLDLPKGVVEIGEHLLMDVLGTLKGQAPGAIYAVGSDYSFEYEDTPPAKSLVEFLRQCD